VQSPTIALDRSHGDALVVVLVGEHDIHTAPELRSAIAEAIADRRPLAVDLSAATFIDSSILGVLIGARKRALEAGLGFAVCSGAPHDAGVTRILEVTGLIPVLPALPELAATIEVAARGPEAS